MPSSKTKATAKQKLASKPVVQSKPLPSGTSILRRTVTLLRGNWKLFTGIVLIYAVLNLILVRGLSGISDLDTLSSVLQSGLGPLAGGLGGFVVLLSSSAANATPAGGLYQLLLTIMTSLAVIWAFRQVLAGSVGIRVRDGFYLGMYPIVPVIIILLIICVQLLPLLFGVQVYAMFLANGVASTLVETILWGIVAGLLAAVSVYFMISSTFGLYIATLPDMTPIKALRTARQLVRRRRWSVLRRLLYLPFALLLISLVIIVPCIIFVTALAPWLFFVLLMISLPIIHGYYYLLYRELLT